jgi:serine/threonine protein kinase
MMLLSVPLSSSPPIGGDLRYYLTTRGKMSEDMCRFYIAEVILGLEELHQKNIVYR